MSEIRIGTIIVGDETGLDSIRTALEFGIECLSILWFRELPADLDLDRFADRVLALLDGTGVTVSALSLYSNPLADDERGPNAREGWQRLIDAAPRFGCDLISGFTGRLIDRPIPESIPEVARFFEPLLERAGSNGLRIAFENCPMDGDWERGDWNVAHTCDAWEMLFEALPAENLGLEWEPAHALQNLVDASEELRHWVHRVLHVHGKDAVVWPAVISKHGVGGKRAWTEYRMAGYGDTDWRQIFETLIAAEYDGAVDIEGWHDERLAGERELEGQAASVEHLKFARSVAVSHARRTAQIRHP